MVPDLDVAVSFDAIHGAFRYPSAGLSQANIPRDTHDYIGPLADTVRAAYEDGSLQTKAGERAERAREKAEAEAQSGGGGACTATLLCNNDTAGGRRGEVSCTGLVGGACTHGVPVEGVVIPMYTAEQHYYYDMAIGGLLKARANVMFIYLDLACRYTHRFDLLVESLAEQGLADASLVKLKLPWMHAYDHNLLCQLLHSGMFAVSRCSCWATTCCLLVHVLAPLPSRTTAHVLAGGGWAPHRRADGAAVVADQGLLQAGPLHDPRALRGRHEPDLQGRGRPQAADHGGSPAFQAGAERCEDG